MERARSRVKMKNEGRNHRETRAETQGRNMLWEKLQRSRFVIDPRISNFGQVESFEVSTFASPGVPVEIPAQEASVQMKYSSPFFNIFFLIDRYIYLS